MFVLLRDQARKYRQGLGLFCRIATPLSRKKKWHARPTKVRLFNREKDPVSTASTRLTAGLLLNLMSREKEADEEDGFFIETSSTDGLLEEHNGGEFAGLAARTNSSFYGTISLQDRSLTQSSKSSSFYLGDATSRQ